MNSETDLRQPLQGEWDRCAAEGTPLAVLTVAPDHASASGDNLALQELERALHVHCGRDRDIVIRRNDGSFVAILPDTLPPGARNVGEQILDAMRHTPHPDGTVSVGIAGVVPSESEEALSLLTRSAHALRAAQNQGGDRCAGGGAAAASGEGAVTSLRKLLQKTSPASGRQRRTD